MFESIIILATKSSSWLCSILLTEISSLRLFLLITRSIVSNRLANKFFQSSFINIIAFAKINGTRRFGIKPGIEKFIGVFQRSAFEKVELYVIFENSGGNHISFLRPHRRIPFPFFCEI